MFIRGQKSVLTDIPIGIYAVAFAWLVSIQQQKIYGVSIWTLLRWAYPGFYMFYFLIFIGNVLVGLYACSVPGRGWAIVFATLGFVIGVVYSVWVCYRFVLDFYARYRIAKAYHYAQITMADRKNDMIKQKYKNVIFLGIVFNIHPDECRAMNVQNEELKRKIEQSINLLGHMIVEQTKNGECIHAGTVTDLWIEAYLSYKKLIIDKSLSAENKNELCYLAEQFWNYAFPKSLLLNEQIKLVIKVIGECHFRKDNKEAVDCLMAGLLLSLLNDEDGMEYGRIVAFLPKIAWQENHWISINKITSTFRIYESLFMGYLWVNAKMLRRITSAFSHYIEQTELISTDKNGITIKSENEERIENFLLTIDNAFSESKGWPKDLWSTKQDREALLQQMLQKINSDYFHKRYS